jgi:hypothetical protein
MDVGSVYNKQHKIAPHSRLYLQEFWCKPIISYISYRLNKHCVIQIDRSVSDLQTFTLQALAHADVYGRNNTIP